MLLNQIIYQMICEGDSGILQLIQVFYCTCTKLQLTYIYYVLE